MVHLSRATILRSLQAAALLTMTTGLIASLGAHSATDFVWLWLFDLLRWPLDGHPAVFSNDTQAVNAVLGGVMIGWGALMLTLAREDVFDERIRVGMQASLLLWFSTDSAGSLAAGLHGNVVLNILFLLVFLIPLQLLKRAKASFASPHHEKAKK